MRSVGKEASYGSQSMDLVWSTPWGIGRGHPEYGHPPRHRPGRGD